MVRAASRHTTAPNIRRFDRLCIGLPLSLPVTLANAADGTRRELSSAEVQTRCRELSLKRTYNTQLHDTPIEVISTGGGALITRSLAGHESPLIRNAPWVAAAGVAPGKFDRESPRGISGRLDPMDGQDCQ